MLPLHAVLVGILMFVTEVMVIFATQLNNVQAQALSGATDPTVTGGIDVTNILAFAAPNVAFIRGFATIVTLVLTVVNAWAPHVTDGGHHHKVWAYLAVMMVISGLGLMFVPQVVSGLFESVSSDVGDTTLAPITGG
jgi:archaellum biogenesis protein FlaJ (TadC family)